MIKIKTILLILIEALKMLEKYKLINLLNNNIKINYLIKIIQ
jgi:hypothetical protein